MAERVVDRFEVVQIEKEHGDVLLAIELERMLEVDPKRGAVREIGQGIVKCLVNQLFLERLALADVPRVQYQALDRRKLEEVGDRHLARTIGVVLPP